MINSFGCQNCINAENLQKELKQKNPGWSGEVEANQLGNDNLQFNAISISGTGFKDTSPLNNISFSSLGLYDTELENLDFLTSPVIIQNLISLLLSNNLKMNDFNALSEAKIEILHIEKTSDFSDTTLINSHVDSLSLRSTGVKELKLRFSEKIRNLTLNQNSFLSECSQVSKMDRLQRFESDTISGIDFANLKALTHLQLNSISDSSFPNLPNQSYVYINITDCPGLSSIETLKGKRVYSLHLVLRPQQLDKFVETLSTMEIANLVIYDYGSQIPLNLLKIKGLQNFNFNEKRIFSANSDSSCSNSPDQAMTNSQKDLGFGYHETILLCHQ